MTNKVYDYYKDLPSWAKGIVVVGGIAIVYFTSKSIIKRLRASASLKQAKATIEDSIVESKNLQHQGMRMSYSPSQYKSWADGLQKQFDGCDGISDNIIGVGWSKSGSYVSSIFGKLKNDVDWLELVKAYGIRTYDQCGWGTGDFTGNLNQAITDELDGRERIALNTMLSKQGIKYTI